METLTVALGDRAYPIYIGEGLLADAVQHLKPLLAEPRCVIISDSNVAEYYLPALQQSLHVAGITAQPLVVPAGEGSKNWYQLGELLETILAAKPTRHTTVIALGGGVVGDLTGLTASLLLRGVPFIQIPTSLLAQVDSSVGGKTAVNSAAGKNLVGSFYQPDAVLIDSDVLATLPDREMRAGYAEVLKYGLIDQPELFDWLEQQGGAAIMQRKPDALTRAITQCCAAKAAIVAADEREAGQRMLLNLGHTFAHALEAACGYDTKRLNHGEAVAIGLHLAALLSVRLGLCADSSVPARIAAHLRAIGLPALPREIAGGAPEGAAALVGRMAGDKKALHGSLRFVLMRGIGEAMVQNDVNPQAVTATLEAAS